MSEMLFSNPYLPHKILKPLYCYLLVGTKVKQFLDIE